MSVVEDFIAVQGLEVSYDGEKQAIAELDMSIRAGEFVAVLGPSGCGKSTLLQVLSGLLEPAAGRATIDGKDVTAGDAPRVGYVFQDHRLLPWRTVKQNIELAMAAAEIPKAQWPERVARYLNLLQIGDYADAWPMRLSGGQRQRVSIARALAIEPAVVLMDEPFSTLDEVTARVMRQQLVDLWQESGHAVVFVTHSIREAVFLADRIFVLTAGPARLLEALPVEIPRPRLYEDAALTELEAKIVARVMAVWGYDTPDGDEQP